MLYLIAYVLLLIALMVIYALMYNHLQTSVRKDVHYNIEKIGFDYVDVIMSRWDRIYKKDVETRKLLFGGRIRFFNGDNHGLSEIYRLYKSYDFEYLDKLFNEKIPVQGYKEFEQKIQMLGGACKTLFVLRTILMVLTLGIIYLFIGKKKYC